MKPEIRDDVSDIVYQCWNCGAEVAYGTPHACETQPLPQASSSEPVRESAPFVITQLQILMMASACLSAQAIADGLERDEPKGERHGS